MGKDHTATSPIPCGMGLGAWRGIAHTILQRQGQGNAALVEVRLTAAAWQSGFEGSELLSQIGTCWSRRTWYERICGVRPGCCYWLSGKPWWRLAAVWHALPVGWRPLHGCLALLLLAPLRIYITDTLDHDLLWNKSRATMPGCRRYLSALANQY
jgi:hypothetical protein